MNLLHGKTDEPPWRHWYRRALPTYWVFLFCVTHLPDLKLRGPLPSPDKWSHFIAFALLAFLFWRCAETIWRPLSWRFVWIAAFWLTLYAAFDEYTQQFARRSSDPVDFLCDVGGILPVLALLEWRRRARSGTHTAAA